MGSMRNEDEYVQFSGYVVAANRNKNGGGGELGRIRNLKFHPEIR
jgi:hypothetical protein